MKFIAHRRNSLAELQATPTRWGVEVDIRSMGHDLIVHHDAFQTGERFEDWLSGFEHGTLILNVKEDGLETRLLSLMESHGIKDFFFLDQAFPTLVKCAGQGEKRCAIRVSEFEPVDMALSLSGQIEWAWIDCFTRLPITRDDAVRLQSAGFRLCLVSPELQGRTTDADLQAMADLIRGEAIPIDAICTKRADLWEKVLSCSNST